MDRRDQQWLPPAPAFTGTPAPVPTEPYVPPAQHEPHVPASHEPPPKRKNPLERIGGAVLLIGALALKFGKVAFVALKGAKFLTTSASMLVSVAAYALIWGWAFGVGFVALLFVHEMGHYIQLRREGIRPTGMWFIPFLGAVVNTRSLGGNALAEARVGLAGPVVGTLGAALCLPIYEATGNEMFKALAFIGFFLNLFNLLPVLPLDGGRAMAAMAPWMWFLGLGAMAVFAFTFPNPVILLILLFAIFETYRRWKTRRAGEEGNAAYYRVKPAHRVMVGAVYLGLIAALVLGMDATYVDRDFDDV